MLTKSDLIESVKDAQITTIEDAAVAVNMILKDTGNVLFKVEKVVKRLYLREK